MESLLDAVERNCAIPRADFCSSVKNERAIRAKEMLILVGLEVGAGAKLLSEITGVSRSAISRRRDAVRLKMRQDPVISKLAERIRKSYVDAV